ncbi:hypothetical protein HGH92_15715 [Chitinophaga varians]|uniref:Uncharacterized protein n=1 Tax=Chitinophaga varians TaxID=2202339 RepID=A0A847RIN3_9BACT|nr:hypothetical protein [Chitinophaga varians]NLR65760.1 hypothetical protein [Chitinophaga varians]
MTGKEYIDDHRKKVFNLSYAFTWLSAFSLFMRLGGADKPVGIQEQEYFVRCLAVAMTRMATIVVIIITAATTTWSSVAAKQPTEPFKQFTKEHNKWF